MTTSTMQDQNVQGQSVRNFSSRKVVRFQVDHVGGEHDGEPEFFDGVPGLAALQLIEFSSLFDKVATDSSDDVSPETFEQMIQLVLTDESAERFIARLHSKENPIGMDQFMDIMPWLMEQYGMRPIVPSELSSQQGVNPDGGTNLTGNLQAVVVPLSSPSPQTDS